MKFSVITPVYNRHECVERCLDSVSSQLSSLPADCFVEHVIVDDGSSDESVSVINAYADRHAHVKTVFFKHNRGVNAARNAAISAAEGDWCLLLDSDDCLAHDALVNIYSTIKSNPGFRSYMFTVDDRKNDFSDVGSPVVFTFEDFLIGRISGDFGHVIDRNLMLAHPFDENLRIYEGIFFMCFYREASRMLFSNIVTHLRERDRADSVSLAYVRFTDAIIARRLSGAKLQLGLFESDYARCGRYDIIEALKIDAADNALLLGDYAMACDYLSRCRHSFKSFTLRIICALRIKRLYKTALQAYLSIKHRRPKEYIN